LETILTGNEMSMCDQLTSNIHGISSEILMERAALAMAEFIHLHLKKTDKIGILCGPGNNGGDGVCLCRILKLQGYKSGCYVLGSENSYTPLMRKQIQIFESYGYRPFHTSDELKKSDVVIDCVFGTGLHRPIEGEYLSALRWFDSFPGMKIACDLPSGIDAENGQVLGFAPHVDYTLTFAYRKLGHLLFPGREYAGEVHSYDVGIYLDHNQDQNHAECLTRKDAYDMLPMRLPSSNKGTYGRVLIVAGSSSMSGAAYLSAAASFSMGTGLVYVLTHENNRQILGQLLPEAIIHTYDENPNGPEIAELMSSVSTVLIGPGFSCNETAKTLLRFLLQNMGDRKLVLDADALNIISEDSNRLYQFPRNTVITPHLGEMSRLIGISIPEIKRNLIGCAKTFSKRYQVNVILKDATTVISTRDGGIYLNETGNNGMSTAGSGDVLAGIVTGLLGAGLDMEEAIILAPYLHGYAGDLAAEEKTVYSMTARDILSQLPNAIKEIIKVSEDTKSYE